VKGLRKVYEGERRFILVEFLKVVVILALLATVITLAVIKLT